MSVDFEDELTKPIIDATAKSFAALAERMILGIGGEKFAKRTARIENKKSDILLQGEIERDKKRAAAKHKGNIAALAYDHHEHLVKQAIERLGYDAAWTELNLENILGRSKLIADQRHKREKFDEKGHDDWLFQWFKYAREVSTPELQDLWARLIVEQTREEGDRISLKALDTLRFLNKRTAETFRAIVQRKISANYSLDYEFFGEPRKDEASSMDIIDDLELLKDIGLIRSSTYQTMSVTLYAISLDYSEIDINKPGVLHSIDLSKVGEELAEIAIPGFLQSRDTIHDFYRSLQDPKKRPSQKFGNTALTDEIMNDLVGLGQIAVMSVLHFGYGFRVKDLVGEKDLAQLEYNGKEITFRTGDTSHLSIDERHALEALADGIREEARRILD